MPAQSTEKPEISHKISKVVVLAKDEENNLTHSLPKLLKHFDNVEVWDSGSTDQSKTIASDLGATVKDYVYVSHRKAYQDIIESVPEDEYCIVLDADMDVSDDLATELMEITHQGIRIASAPVIMVHFGYVLKHASLYPPKPILFRGGESPFVSRGHGETIPQDIPVVQLKSSLMHDDRKSFLRFLQSQIYYGTQAAKRYRKLKKLRFRERLLAKHPLVLSLLYFFVSYILRRGFLDGKGGYLYAYDRMVACMIVHRQHLVYGHKSEEDESEENESNY